MAFVNVAYLLLGFFNQAAASSITVKSQLQSKSHLKTQHAGSSFIRSLAFKHRLRVCNAYPNAGTVDVYHGSQRITDSPMPYKTCGEFSPVMRAGDKLQFKVSDEPAGSFEVADLPRNDAVLVLVIYRHDTMGTAVAFESHVFANLINAQIAVLDTYQGVAKALPRIQDAKAFGITKTPRSEELRYDSVVAVNPGIYEVVFQSQCGELKASQQLVALNRESYVVVRTGVEAREGQAYPQELLVFPHSDPKVLMGSGAYGIRAAWVSIMALCVAAWVAK